MSDIYCAKCAEPWDAYGVRHGDMKPYEADRFSKGEGCPCCDFGTRCTHCKGTGVHSDHTRSPLCAECRDEHKLLVREPLWGGFRLEYNYQPNVRRLTESQAVAALVIGGKEQHRCRDGSYLQYFVLCPHCMVAKGRPRADLAARFPVCDRCTGTGKFTLTPEQAEERQLAAAASAIDASDEDPIEILEERGLAIT